jgi:hypothetical protein
MNIDSDTKRFIIHRLKWLGLYFGIGFILIFILPYPYDLVSVIVLFILINLWRGRVMMKKYGGIGGIKDMLGSLQSHTSGNNRPLNYYCMVCGKEHREIACPSCGSKMKRVG